MIIIGAVLLAAAVAVTHIFSEIPRWSKLLIFAVPYIVLGLNVILDAVHGLAGKQFLDEKFLMSVASVGALAVGEYAEAVLVMLLYRLGELLQSIAVGKSRRSIADLMDICPESAELETVDGIKQVSPDEVHVGDIFVVRAGERVPLDGIVVEGSSSLNTAALTGESAPRDVAAGESITSGCINIQGTLRVRAEREYEDSTVARMLELIKKRELYNKIRSLVYTECCRTCYFACNYSAAFLQRLMVGVDLPRVDFPCYFLPLCACHICSADVFRRNRRSGKTRHTRERFQLYGDAFALRNGTF